MAGRWGRPGGILGLLDLIEEHRAAFEYDWRHRFGLPLSDVPAVMGWDEAVRLTGLLRRDPSSWVAAALEGWDYPITRENTAILDLFDVQYASKSKRAKPHPGRPWIKSQVTRVGNTGGRSQVEIRRILREYGHAV